MIVGEPSFGKGTVQTVVDLDQIVRNSKPEFAGLICAHGRALS
ncbi:hypothetical protein ACC736_37970 [Rhizobium ruizarguesonis]